ncbi:lysozyme inhibitor LprI family protein [Atopomonas hussainii]|uniref:lysozyme inhibitor LprI family protein n=1 Tax=Atopomonas hussainii TaxID=1429083 RepID=UPI0009004507|nr:lysozyme inhibitor LprI family protein [Atopomonas hussainii]
MKPLAILAFLALSQSIYASDYFENVSGIEFSADSPEKCFKFDSLRTYNCIQHFHKESQEALDTTFKHISSEVKRDSALLKDSQEKWLAFKKSECKLRSVSASALQNPTAQGQLFFEVCTIELNNERVDQLNSIQLGCDSCLQ